MAENSNITTEYGNILITKNVIGKIVLDVVAEYRGKVLISNHKGKFTGIVGRLSGVDEISNMEILFDKDGVPDIKIYVIIRFGTSITKVTHSLIEKIQKKIYTLIERDPASISVVVAGTISKNIAKRNIEIMKRYDY